MQVCGVPAEWATNEVWEMVEPYIEGALDWACGEETVEDVKQAVKEREYQLWVVGDGVYILAAFTTQIVKYPQFKACRIKHFGGRMNDEILKKAWELVGPWAKANGCERLEAIGRPGWEKAAKNVFPFRKVYSVIHGEIT